MKDASLIKQERSVLRWGGLAGMLGSALLILAIVVVILSPIGMDDPVELSLWVERFPDIHMARVVENFTYLFALIMGVPLFLALYRALRRTSLAPALFGSTIGIIGLVSMILSSLPHIAHHKLSTLYQTPGISAADQQMIAIVWQALWGLNDLMTYIGFFVVPIGIMLLTIGMFESNIFGKTIAWVSLAIGAIGFVSAILQIIDPASIAGLFSYLSFVPFYFILGWKIYSASKSFSHKEAGVLQMS